MKSIKLFMMTAALVGGLSFTGCSSDDDASFLPPTVAVGSQVSNSINLIDGTIYNMAVDIKSEAGLKSIVVKDNQGNSYPVTNFVADSKSVTSLDIDLQECQETTLLLLTIEATDNAGKTIATTEPFSLNVYVPEVYVSASSFATIVDHATLNITVGRGMKALKSVEFAVNGSVVPELTEDVSAKGTDKTFTFSKEIEGLNVGENSIEIKVTDVDNILTTQVAKIDYINGYNESINITQGEIAYKLKVRRNRSTGLVSFVMFNCNGIFDDETGLMSKYNETTWYFEYNDNNKVSKIEEMVVPIDPDMGFPAGDEELTKTYEFTYDEFNQLTKVTLNGNDYVTDVVYENGNIKSYSVVGVKENYQPKYVEYNGKLLRVDYQDASLTGTSFITYDNMYFNPYYIAELPAVIPGDIAELPIQFLYNPYLYKYNNWNGWEKNDNDDFVSFETTYTKDSKEWNANFSIVK